MIFNADNGKYRCKQFITPMVRKFLLPISKGVIPDFTNSFIAILRKLNYVTLSIGVLFIWSRGIALSVMIFG